MTIQRISNVAVFNSTMRDIIKTQSELYDLQGQISSGYKSNDYKGLGSQAQQYIGLDIKLNKIDMYLANNQIATARVKTAQSSLDTITTLTNDIKNLMVTSRNPLAAPNLNFVQQMKDKLQAVADKMNVTFEGRYLMSGTSTDVKPVPMVPVANIADGVADAGYYAGSNVSTTARVDDAKDVQFPVRADDPAFQALFASVNMAINAYTQNSDSGMKAAIDMAQSSQDKQGILQSKVSNMLVDLSSLNDEQTSTKAYWKGLSDQISKTDVVAASTQVSSDETVLKASYQVFARLSKLRLTDFL